MHSRPSVDVLTEWLETVLELSGVAQKSPRQRLPRLHPLELEHGTVLPGGLASRGRGSEGAKGGPGLVQERVGAGRAAWGTRTGTPREERDQSEEGSCRGGR